MQPGRFPIETADPRISECIDILICQILNYFRFRLKPFFLTRLNDSSITTPQGQSHCSDVRTDGGRAKRPILHGDGMQDSRASGKVTSGEQFFAEALPGTTCFGIQLADSREVIYF